jgi:hypothetical protein
MTKIEIVSKSDFDEFKEVVLSRLDDALNKTNESREWYRSVEVADMLGISTGTLKNLRDSRRISFTKVGGTLLYRLTDINQMLLANMIQIEN